MYAIIEAAGSQYRVETGDVIALKHLTAVADGKVTFDRVLAIGDAEGEVKLGAPCVAGASVSAELIEEFQGRKVRVFKMKRRKASTRRNKGHRDQLSRVRITGIEAGA